MTLTNSEIMLNKKQANLNRSIFLSEKDIEKYSKRTIRLDKNVNLKTITNQVINQDIFEALNYLPEKFVDLLFIDPPYNLTKKFNNVSFKEMNDDDYESWLDSWLSKMKYLLKDNSSIYICGDWKSSSAISRVCSKYFLLKNRITWEREKGRGAKSNWKNCSEDIWFFTNSSTYTFNVKNVKLRRKVLAPYKDERRNPKDWNKNISGNFRDTYPSNIWNDITVPFWSMPENTNHPTQKPEKLLAKIILASTNKDDFVFDPFLGSGTTAVVSKKLHRKFLGIEIDAYYCSLALKRLEMTETDKKIQGYEDKVFWERNTLTEQFKNKRARSILDSGSKVKRK